MHKWKNHYFYYQNGELSYVSHREFFYDNSLPETVRVMRQEVSRYYFQQGKMVKWLMQPNKDITPANPRYDYQGQKTELVTLSQQLVKVALSPDE